MVSSHCGSCVSLLAVFLVAICAGCDDSGNSQRVVPEQIASTITDASKLEALVIAIPDRSLQEPNYSPVEIAVPDSLAARSPLELTGRLKLDKPPVAIVYASFYRMHPKYGRVVTNECTGHLVENDGFWAYKVPIDVPVDAGEHFMEIKFQPTPPPGSGESSEGLIIGRGQVKVTSK